MSLWIDQKYINLASSRLEKFKKVSATTYNFRCPYCGDSRKDKNKARGFLFLTKDGFFYKCHNCGVSKNFATFLTDLDASVGANYKAEVFIDKNLPAPYQNKLDPQAEVIFKNLLDSKLRDVGCTPISEMDEGTHAVQYVMSRQIPKQHWLTLYHCPNMERFAEINPAYEGRIMAEERLVIPFHNKMHRLSGVTGRAMGNSKLRYVAIRLAEGEMLYNLKNVDMSKDVYLLEGALDSTFIDNAVGVGGSDMMRACKLFDPEKCVLIFDNEPRNKDIVKIMEKLLDKGYGMVIWPDAWKYKDINAAILGGMSKGAIQELIYKNTFRDLSLKLQFYRWKKT